MSGSGGGARPEISARPTIGLSCYWRQATFGAWTLDACLVGQGYVEGVRLAGGRALALPPDPAWAEDPADAIDRLDGLLLAGGDDIDPALWGEPRHPATAPPARRRDEVEPALLRCAIEQGKPVLGICRGMQLINVALGGTLDQHMADTMDQRPHREDDSTYGRHRLLLEPGSRVAEILGDPAELVHSHHHQQIATLAPGLTVSARAPDGVIEGIELEGEAFCVGVLWHPDAAHRSAGAKRVFGALVDAAREGAERRALAV